MSLCTWLCLGAKAELRGASSTWFGFGFGFGFGLGWGLGCG